MAYSKNIPDPTGTAPVAAYIRFTGLELNVRAGTVVASYEAHRDEASRQQSKEPVRRIEVRRALPQVLKDSPELFNIIAGIAYASLKADLPGGADLP